MEGKISEERAAFLAKDYARGFIQYCRFTVDEIEHGFFQSRVAILEHHRQQDGFIHAGVMATMADHTAGYAGFTTVSEEFQILTIEFKINFLKPAHGEALVCRSNIIRGGKQIILAESEVFDIHKGEESHVRQGHGHPHGRSPGQAHLKGLMQFLPPHFAAASRGSFASRMGRPMTT